MSKKKPKKPPAKTERERSYTPPPPPSWDRPVGAPEPIDPDKDAVSSTPIMMLDEETFMKEVASRLNAFINTYPHEAQHVLSEDVLYQHELVDIHTEIRRRDRARKGMPPEDNPPAPGISIAGLFAAILQTHHGNGWVLRPILLPNPDAGVGEVMILKFVAERQEDLDTGPKS